MQVSVFSNQASWVEAALDELRGAVDRAAAEGRAALALCLAGGLSPEGVYRAMAALPLQGMAVDLWLGDERAVPAGDPARNGSMIARAFEPCAWEPRPRLRPWPETPSEADAAAAALGYEAELTASLGPAPIFDLALLGLGADGHTASIFPGSPPAPAGRLAYPSRSPLPPYARMTLAPGVLHAARRRIFLVKGGDKLEALRRLEAEDPSIPASLMAGPGALVLYLG
jgi:6-phosphogluconolactonase